MRKNLPVLVGFTHSAAGRPPAGEPAGANLQGELRCSRSGWRYLSVLVPPFGETIKCRRRNIAGNAEMAAHLRYCQSRERFPAHMWSAIVYTLLSI
jgi:hypothetical protein